MARERRNQNSTLRRKVRFEYQGRSKRLTDSPRKTAEPRPLRLAKLMALAIRYQQLMDLGQVANRAELSQLAEVSPARLTQITNLLLLAPDIQEEILFLPFTATKQDPISDRDMRPIVAELDWQKQRQMWKLLKARFAAE